MRASTWLAGGAVSFVIGAVTASATAGCVDLFHSTDFNVGDAAVDAPSSDSGGGLDDFCALDASGARAAAEHACTWLAACETPTGGNTPGACLEHALLAFDCHANPNRPVIAAAHDAWRCLASAQSCADVDTCIFHGSAPKCGSGGGTFSAFDACGSGAASAARVSCRAADSAAAGEPCALFGQTCASNGGDQASCTGTTGLGCSSDACNGTWLTTCGAHNGVPLADAGLGTRDLGVDCASFGGGQCVSLATGPACLAKGGAQCTGTAAVRCEGAVAVGCPSGVEERIDCSVFGGRCSVSPITGLPVAQGAAWDVARACVPAGATCTGDACNGAALVACVHGAPTSIDCVAGGLGACAAVPTTDGGAASCAHP